MEARSAHVHSAQRTSSTSRAFQNGVFRRHNTNVYLGEPNPDVSLPLLPPSSSRPAVCGVVANILSVQVDASPEGKAQRLRQEQQKAKRRAEKLGILVDSYGDFEVDAGTAAANMMGQERETAPVDGETGGSQIASAVAAAGAGVTADAEGQKGVENVAAKEGRRRQGEEEAAKAKENRVEEEERKAREELKEKKLYGQEMTAIAMGHPEAAQGPGKLTSMGSSSYVVDMVRRTETELIVILRSTAVYLIESVLLPWRNSVHVLAVVQCSVSRDIRNEDGTKRNDLCILENKRRIPRVHGIRD